MEIAASHALAQSITQAIRSGDLAQLSEILDTNPGIVAVRIVDERTGGSRTLLHIATDWPGHFPQVGQTITLLIAKGADPNLAMEGTDAHRETPLHWAASSNDVEALDALLDGGADIDGPGAVFTGGTAMSDAVIFACWEAGRRLLERGAKTTFTQSAGLGLMDRLKKHFEQETLPGEQELRGALWHACRGGQLATVKFLIEKGADRNWIGWDHLAPLDCARQSGNAALVEWLQRAGSKAAKELNA